MTVKSTVSFTDRHHQFAKRKVKEGVYGSVSGMVAVGIERIMQDEEEREAAISAMKNRIRERMGTPRDEWVEVDDDDPAFVNASSRLDAPD